MMIQVVTIAPFITQTFFIVSLWEPTRVSLRDDTQPRFDAMLGAPNKIENKAESAESIETSVGKLLSTTTSNSNDKQQITNKKQQTTNQPTYQPINRRTTTNTTTIPTPAATPQPQQPQLQLLQPSKIQTASTCTRTSTPSSKPLFHYKKLSTRIKKLSMASPIFVGVAFWFQKIDMKFEIQISELLTALGPAATPQLCQATGDPNPERWSLAQRQVREKGLPLASATVAPGRSGLFITYIYNIYNVLYWDSLLRTVGFAQPLHQLEMAP